MTSATRHTDAPAPERHDVRGAQWTTYRIGGPIDRFVQPKTLDQAVQALASARERGEPVTVLGWGSNLLIADAGIRGLTLCTRGLDAIEPLGDGRYRFGAGLFLGRAATEVHKAGLAGGEFWVGIPGTIGGAVRMNAGAMGQETCEPFVSAWVFNLQTGEVETWDAARMDFAYRHSALDPTRHIVLAAEFAFEPGDPAVIGQRMAENMQFRRSHHPLEPNAGSVFRNPAPDQPAGRILEGLGAKAWVEGGARVSPRHANFIINTGDARSVDVLRLMRRMQQAIQEQTGLEAHPENVYVGEASEEEQAVLGALRL